MIQNIFCVYLRKSASHNWEDFMAHQISVFVENKPGRMERMTEF